MEFTQFTMNDCNTWLEIKMIDGIMLLRKQDIRIITKESTSSNLSLFIAGCNVATVLPCEDDSETTMAYNYLRNIL